MKIIKMFDRFDSDLDPKFIRSYPPFCFIGHTTGYGDGLKALDLKTLDDARVSQLYAERMDDTLKHKGQFLIGRGGEVYQFSPWESYASWHTGSSNRGELRHTRPPAWWRLRHPELANPTDLPAWSMGSPNRASIGWDLLAPRGGGSNFPDVQRESAVNLVAWLSVKAGILVDDHTLTSHSSVDPIARGGPRGAWDLPDSFDMPGFIRSVRAKALEYGISYDRRQSVIPDP